MPTDLSFPASKYLSSQSRINALARCETVRQNRGSARVDSQGHYHAAFVASVAAWEAFIEDVTRHFLGAIAKPLVIDYSALHDALTKEAETALRKFNTPNSKNTRELLIRFTGYDPINDWIWPRRGMGGVQVRVTLDEILDIRHSFAHGYKIPSVKWLQDGRGSSRFTRTSFQFVQSFFKNLVTKTDRGLRTRAHSIFSITTRW